LLNRIAKGQRERKRIGDGDISRMRYRTKEAEKEGGKIWRSAGCQFDRRILDGKKIVFVA
jgi:hypothetical protein